MQHDIAFWRRTPPALFPPLLGLFGAGHGWVRAGEVFGFPRFPGDALLAITAVLFVAVFAAFAAKVLARPAVLLEDLTRPPARAAIPAGTVCWTLLALALVPYFPTVAKAVLIAGLALHGIVTLAVLRAVTRPGGPGVVVPAAMHLPFVGAVVGMICANALGWHDLARIVLWPTAIIAAGLWSWGAVHAVRSPVPPPLRPLTAIHLAPAGIVGIVAYPLGYETLFGLMVWGTLALALFLAARLRWLTEAGFSPVWGAFTFPVAAFANLQLLAWSAGHGVITLLAGGLALLLVSCLAPVVAFLTLRDWSRGTLAAKTGAAVA